MAEILFSQKDYQSNKLIHPYTLFQKFYRRVEGRKSRDGAKEVGKEENRLKISFQTVCFPQEQ